MKFLRKYLKKKYYLVRLILTITGFVCVPLIFTQLVMMERASSGYIKLSEKHIFEKLQECSDSFVERTKDMGTVAYKVSQDVVISKASKDFVSDYAVYEAAQMLDKYSGDIEVAGVYFGSNGMILFDKYKKSLDQFCILIAGDDSQCRADVYSFFKATDSLSVMASTDYEQSDRKVVIVGRRISWLSVSEKDTMVFFVMEQDELEEDFRERFRDCSGVALLDSSGRFLVKGEGFERELCESTEFKDFLKDEERLTYEVPNSQNGLRLYKYNDSMNGYVCLASVSMDDLDSQLMQYMDTIRKILMVSILLMCILLSLAVRVNYKPIGRLTKKHGGKVDSGEFSELELLDYAFFEVDQKVLNQEKLLINFLISDLLSGKEVDKGLLEEFFPLWGSSGCIVISLDGPMIDSARSNQITAILKEKTDCDIYITGITYRPQILMVCVFYRELDITFLRACVEEVLEDVMKHTYNISTGKAVTQIIDIRASYLQAILNAGEEKNVAVEMDEGVAQAIRRFGESLYTGDASNVQQLLDIVEVSILSIDEGSALQKYYCYKLLTVYFANTKEGLNSQREMEYLVGFENPGQLFGLLRQSVRRLCARINNNEQARADRLHKKLLDYVDVNFNNQNLCLTSAADYLGTSIYVVSRLFKEATGRGFKAYITDKRLEYARELLQSTAYSVKEITVLSGFEKTDYFSSMFKAKYGLPPTQYRKNCKE